MDKIECHKARWERAITKVFPGMVPQSETWNDASHIAEVLQPFCGGDLNCLFNNGTGHWHYDWVGCSNHEAGCIDFSVEVGVILRCRPLGLRFESFPNSPWNSFFYLPLGSLTKSGGHYDGDDDIGGVSSASAGTSSEDVVVLEDGMYRGRKCWYERTMDVDEDGDPIHLRTLERPLVRYSRGSLMISCTKSNWNQIVDRRKPGCHNRLNVGKIRAVNQKLIDIGLG